jgi:hypothetical protein
MDEGTAQISQHPGSSSDTLGLGLEPVRRGFYANGVTHHGIISRGKRICRINAESHVAANGKTETGAREPEELASA